MWSKRLPYLKDGTRNDYPFPPAKGRCSTIPALVENINRLFGEVANTTGLVLLSTIHKAKGLEAPKVWLLDTGMMPGPQENNIRYVAITRAKETLVFVPCKE